MKSITIELPTELPKNSGASLARSRRSIRERADDYIELSKPRIASLIVIITAAGFYIGSGDQFDFSKFFLTLIGVALLSGGIGALNQYVERDIDARMPRTAARPLPANRLRPNYALVFGLALTLLGEALLLVVNPLTALLGFLTAIGYVLIYTPLKTKTSLSTWLGAFPGAVPPLIGYAAASGELSALAWTLFAIQFLWQFPHFLAIAWMYRDDYRRGGIKMLPVTEPSGAISGLQSITYALLLIPVSLLPLWLGVGGRIYFFGALLLGIIYLWGSVVSAFSNERADARRLLLISVIYLPVLFTLLVVNG